MFSWKINLGRSCDMSNTFGNDDKKESCKRQEEQVTTGNFVSAAKTLFASNQKYFSY